MSSIAGLRCLPASFLHHRLFGNILGPILPISQINYQQACFKHYDQKFRKERGAKVIKVNLPDFDEQRRDEKLSVEEMRSKLKEKGVNPFRTWTEKPLFIGCSGDIIDAYVPPEGDGKVSAISTSGMKQMYETVGKKGKSYMALRKIRNLDYEFDIPTVAQKVQEVYIDAQNALAAHDEDKLHGLVTEKAYPEMYENVKNKTIVWKFIQSLEPPRIVHIRVTDLMTKGNLFAQVTARLHTQQTLAIYDRFGRLIHGSRDTVKDVLEYVVLEKHLTLIHGSWRLHGKIIPDWLPPKDPAAKTFYLPDIDKDFPEPPEKKLELSDKDKESNESSLSPAVA